MTQTPPPATSLPHHKLFAYELCLSLVKLVAKTRVADAQLRAQARKSAASAALNCAEGAARQTRAIRLTADHWLLVARRHWGVETSHQILDNAFEEDDHPWIEACPRAALVVAILRRIAGAMLALFRSVTQRSDERRAAPWETLMTDLFVALISTTELELRDPKALRLH